MHATVTSAGVSDQREFLPPGMAAQMLGVSQETLKKYVDKGLITPVFTDGGHRRFRTADVRSIQNEPTPVMTPELRMAIRAMIQEELAARTEGQAQERQIVQVIDLRTNRAMEFDNFTEACRQMGWKRGSAWHAVKRNSIYQDRYKVINAFTAA